MKDADNPEKKEILKAAKEITVKFIETGRISPANFSAIFPEIYQVVQTSVSCQPNNIVIDDSATDSCPDKNSR